MAKYQVVNRFTGAVVGAYGTKDKARKARDKHDLAWGSYAHTIKPPTADLGQS